MQQESDNNLNFSNAYCKSEYKRLFDSQEKKTEYFDKLASYFFDKNFSTVSKADIELLMFNFLMKQYIEKSDGILDYNECSDYNMSKILGITEARVRNLKVKKELKYPEKYKWIESFASILANNKFTSSENNRIKINIPDPNVYIEIKNYIESKGGFVETHLNSKILDMDVAYLYDFALLLEKESDQEDIKEKALKKIKYKKFASIGTAIIKATGAIENVDEVIGSIESLFDKNNKIVKFINKLKKNNKTEE